MSIDVRRLGADGDLVHVHGSAGKEHRARLGESDDGDRVRRADRRQPRPLERIDGDVDLGPLAVAHALAVVEHRRLVLLALADHDGAAACARCRASFACRPRLPGRQRSCRLGPPSGRRPSRRPRSLGRARGRGCGREASSRGHPKPSAVSIRPRCQPDTTPRRRKLEDVQGAGGDPGVLPRARASGCTASTVSTSPSARRSSHLARQCSRSQARRSPSPPRTSTGRRAGAFTGEVSAAMLHEIGVYGAIVGHSERRQLFGETDEAVARRAAAALEAGLFVIACVGELEEERERGRDGERPAAPGLGARAARESRRRLRARVGDRHRQDGDARDRPGSARVP